ncbi:hypothetical protein ckrop_1885 [Corynebacterium kroppenstedtii DSM 44385]|uniref:DUF3592 domain-containing protein n=1 Tax=Corynebacterium kroppenstedtii (strain DSM 44385 / JCM 11950 / CIP 105744 / CCUG 35717) TaxID=645127 RepID=C4LL95_CORK4|nr:hypothetical protein ckrop_1885 [Corynebacterium kroppenstedtii DSM 44385]
MSIGVNATRTHDMNAGDKSLNGDQTPQTDKSPHDDKPRSPRRTLSRGDDEERIDTVARRCRQAVALIALLMTLVCATLVAGPVYNDIKLHKDKETAIATVNHVGLLRTAISFRDSSGEFHSPNTGVLYPGGLHDGQKVWVEYSHSHPDIVRVQGRTWTLSLLPAVSTFIVTVALSMGAIALINRRAERKKNLYNGHRDR